jgi:hypothetical protein
MKSMTRPYRSTLRLALPAFAAALMFPAVHHLPAGTLTFQPPTPTDWFAPYFDTTEDGQPVTKTVWLVFQGTNPNNPPLPVAADIAVITNGRHAIINSGTAVADTLRVANNVGGGRLEVLGGSVEARLLQVATGTTGEGEVKPGVVVLDGGALAAGTRMQLAGNNSADAIAHLIYRSGVGVVNAFDIGTIGTGVFTLEGAAARDFVPTNVFLGGGRQGRLRFVLGAAAGPLLRVTMAVNVNANAVLEVDGRAYRGDSTTLQLVQATNINGDLTAASPLIQFPTNYTAALRQEVGNLFLDITRTGDPDPEPVSFWSGAPDVAGYRDSTVAGWLFDAAFPWVYAASPGAWMYIDFASGSATAFYAYDTGSGTWLRFDAAFGGWHWNYGAGAWQGW